MIRILVIHSVLGLHMLTFTTFSTKLGLLLDSTIITLIQNAIQRLRGLLEKWGVILTQELLFAALRLPSAIQFQDRLVGDSCGVIDTLTIFKGFLWKVINSGITYMAVEYKRLSKGDKMLTILTRILSTLLNEFLPVSREAITTAKTLVSTIQQYLPT